jgi:hypothetical protein
MFLVRRRPHLCLFATCLGRMLAICLAAVLLSSHLAVIRQEAEHVQKGARSLAGKITDLGGNSILHSDPWQNCPRQGNGGDAQLNRLKNRMDTAAWMPISFEQLAQLPYPQSVIHHDMDEWSPRDAAQVARSNGQPVSVRGYLVKVHPSQPEPANCNSHHSVDYHLLLGKSPTASPWSSIVTEATPRVRARHPGWTVDLLQRVVNRHLPVQISGWTMLDPENDGARVGPWEVHPVMQILVQLNGSWISLDEVARSSEELWNEKQR